MSAKPTDIALWSTGHSNEVAPDGGQVASGWTHGEVPPSAIENWLLRVSGEWQKYLSDGVLQGPITVVGTLTVTDLEATDHVRAPDVGYTTEQVEVIPAAFAQRDSDGPTWADGLMFWSILSAAGRLTYGLPARLKDRITGFTVHGNKTAVGGTFTAQLYVSDENTGTQTAIGNAFTYNGSSGYIELSQQLGHNAQARGGGASSITLDLGASSADHFYRACQVRIVGGTGVLGEARTISDYVGATRVATTSSPWTTPPDATTLFEVSVEVSTTQFQYSIVFTCPGGSVGSNVAHAEWRVRRPLN